MFELLQFTISFFVVDKIISSSTSCYTVTQYIYIYLRWETAIYRFSHFWYCLWRKRNLLNGYVCVCPTFCATTHSCSISLPSLQHSFTLVTVWTNPENRKKICQQWKHGRNLNICTLYVWLYINDIILCVYMQNALCVVLHTLAKYIYIYMASKASSLFQR